MSPCLPSGKLTPSPRCCTRKWQKPSRPPPAEWSAPFVMPSKWPGTEVIWILCKDFSAIPSAIPRENPRIWSLSPWSLTNCSFSWSLLRLPISDWGATGFRLFYFWHRCNEDVIDRSKFRFSYRWTFFVVPMNTPALLGGFYPNEQEYFLHEKFRFWMAYRWIYALLP